MNRADQQAGNKAVDSLINYETVKVRYERKLHSQKKNNFFWYLNHLCKLVWFIKL